MTTNIVESHIQRIYNCKNNHPRKALRIDYKAITTWNDNYPVETIYQDNHGNTIYPDVVNKLCRMCNQPMIQNDVFAVLNEETHCDNKCMNAIGPICRCSCSGPNHGINYLIS